MADMGEVHRRLDPDYPTVTLVRRGVRGGRQRNTGAR
jgi:hypothetical protein